MNIRFLNAGSRVSVLVLLMLFMHSAAWAQKGTMIIRVSEIEIHPEYLQEYNRILREESGASVRLEPGVVAIFPMFQQADPTQVRILEIYANRNAYESHLQTSHFKKYKTETLKMVKSLKLIEMKAIDVDTMLLIFNKIKVANAQMESSEAEGVAPSSN